MFSMLFYDPPDTAVLADTMKRLGWQVHYFTWRNLVANPNKGFAKLPLELKQKIYFHYMEDMPHSIEVNAGRHGPSLWYPEFLPNLCIVHELVRQEAAPVFLKNFNFCFNGLADLDFFMKFLSTLPGDSAFRSIKALEFHECCSYDNRHLALIKKCPALETLGIEISRGALRRTLSGGRRYEPSLLPRLPKTSQVFLDELGFEEIFLLPSLKTLKLSANGELFNHRTRSHPKVIEDLVKRVREGFVARDRKVEVLF